MLRNRAANISVLKNVANALGELKEEVAFVGGAAVSLYADDRAAEDMRPTMDVDIVVGILTSSELDALREKLQVKGIYPDAESTVMCRFRCKDILIDVMSTNEVDWAPSDPWFKPGFENSVDFSLDDDTSIRVFPVAYFLASKFSAFHDRGKDPRTSEDFEDIVYVLDSTTSLVNDVLNSPDEVKNFLLKEFKQLARDEMTEGIACHLNPHTRADRLRILREKLTSVMK